MSLAQSRIGGPLGLKRYHSPKKSESRPRFLKSASFSVEHEFHKELTKLHGDASPQTPMHYNKWLKFGKSDLLSNEHPRPWSSGAAPGRKPSDDSNPYHWTWLTDMQRQGKWTRKEKAAYYEKFDSDRRNSMPHHETIAAKMPRNGVSLHWRQMKDRGSKVGDYEKLDITPSRQTGKHLKGGMYKGVYENVKPYQYIFKTGRKSEDGKPDETETDEREIWDSNLLDDNIAYNWRDTKWAASSTWDTFRPLHTETCSGMGIYFTHR